MTYQSQNLPSGSLVEWHEYLHCCHTEDREESKLCPQTNLEMPDHPDGQKGESEISDYRKCAVRVGDVDNGVNRDAKASARRVNDPGPEEGNRLALKHGDEEEGDAAKDSEAPGDVDDDPVGAVRGETQQETGDTGLD